MNCPKCGAPANAGAKFCTSCGAAIPVSAPQPPAYQPVSSAPDPEAGKKICPICGGKIGMSRAKTTDKYLICGDCFKTARQSVSLQAATAMTLADYKRVLSTQVDSQQRLPSFHPSATVEPYLRVDEAARLWYIVPEKKNGIPIIHSYDEVVEYELLEDGNTVTKGGLGRAAAGAALFGGFGAVVGASTGRKRAKATASRLQLKITLNSMADPVAYINFIRGGEFKKDGMIYKNLERSAQQCLSLFQIMTQGNQQPAPAPQPQASAADEILRFKELLDMGVITPEEFEAKKKQLLGL